jgi:mRNA interferase MazF
MEIKQYQIIAVRIDAASGDSPENTRRCIVISPDEMNRYLRTVIIAPLAEVSAGYPTRPKIKHANKTSRAVLDQVTTIEKQRVLEVLGDLQKPEIKKIKTVLREIFID